MKFSAHIGFLFNELSPFDRIRQAAYLGFSGIEWPNFYGQDFEGLVQLVKEMNLGWPIVVLPQGRDYLQERGLAARPGRQSEFREGLEQAVECANRLGSSIISPMAGVGISLNDYTVMDTYLENLSLSLQFAQSHGLKVAIEVIGEATIPGYALTSYKMFGKLVEELPGLCLILDTFHAASIVKDPVSLINVFGLNIAHVQLGDFPGRHEPGSGLIDFNSLLHSLACVGYGGWYGCEYQPARRTEDGLSWMGRLAGSLDRNLFHK